MASSSTSTSVQASDIPACLPYAEELKTEGNDHYRAGSWKEALAAYRSGLGGLPARIKDKRQEDMQATDAGSAQTPVDDEKEDQPDSQLTDAGENVGEHDTETGPWEKEYSKTRAALHANIAACYVKLGEHKEAVEACTEALLDDPEYVKALQRRASSNEILGTWSSLSAAQEDYNTLLKILPEADPRRKEISSVLEKLKSRAEAAQKRETAEMVDKLKGLGNNILGRFGLSTDNFQFVPNGQGGYSVNFTR
ncbi:hypothetical protein AX14_000077 [Amanita brunnescens Koide BX004]|nr:hypothetical protein AX14_000077 [Amanita brunnescens Koide BX004]